MAKQTKATTKTVEPVTSPDLTIHADATLPYISGIVENPLVSGLRGLSRSIDDVERDFGTEVYDWMLNDPIVAATINGLRRLVLADGFSVQSAIPRLPRTATPEMKRAYDECAEIADFVGETVENLEETDRDLLITMDESLECFSHGHVLSEVTWTEIDQGPWKGMLGLEGVRPKPRGNYLFVVNENMKVLGAEAIIPGGRSALRSGLLGMPGDMDNLVPRDRLFVTTCNPKKGDPRGRSLLRAAYNPWKRRQIMDPEEVKYLVQFGGGMITAEVAASTSTYDVTLPDGTTKQLKNLEFVTQILSQMGGNGGVAAFPEGTTITVHTGGASGGQAFKIAFDRAAREIVMAVLVTARAILEAEKSSQKDTEAALDLVKAIVGYWRRVLGGAVRRQVFRPLVAANFGDERARNQTPVCALAKTAQPELTVDAVVSLLQYAPKGMHAQLYEEVLGLDYVPEEDEEQDAPDKKTSGDDDEEQA